MDSTNASSKMSEVQRVPTNATHHDPRIERQEKFWSPIAAALERFGLSTLAGVKAFRGEVVKNHKGRRDILRIKVNDTEGHERVLFLKRSWKPYKKDGFTSLLSHGRVRSISRCEWENSKDIESAGLRTAGLVATGEECGLLWERFSYILTEAAVGAQTLDQFLRTCGDPARRRAVFDALAITIRKLHDAGLASPDLFTRHIFVDESATPPAFCFIDMARMDHQRDMPEELRARDLAALNITAPLRFVSRKERVRFLETYCGDSGRSLFGRIRQRVEHLLQRKKFRSFIKPGAESAPLP